MGYPLIIFGAGASYDYSSLGKIAPLTNHLINDDFLHPDLLEKYKGAGDLLSDIIHQVKKKKRGFEAVLTEIKERTSHSAVMCSKFAALEFYLKGLFGRISDPKFSHTMNERQLGRIHQINNYLTIINRIQTYSEGKACVITFNYYTLFEHNLGNQAPKRMQDYVSGDIKIFKLHGSHDWSYVQSKSLINYEREGVKDDFEWYLKYPDFINQNLKKDSSIRPYHEQELVRDNNEYAKFPAIAVPLVEKDKYICPLYHIQKLEQILPSIDRVLIIGWKAGDPLLLETLSNHLPKLGYKMLIVSNTIKDAEEIAKVVRKSMKLYNGVIAVHDGDFSDFVADEISNTFFV